MIREKQFHMNHALNAQQNNRSLLIGFMAFYMCLEARDRALAGLSIK